MLQLMSHMRILKTVERHLKSIATLDGVEQGSSQHPTSPGPLPSSSRDRYAIIFLRYGLSPRDSIELAKEIVARAQEVAGHERAAYRLREGACGEAVVITNCCRSPRQLVQTLCFEFDQLIDEISVA